MKKETFRIFGEISRHTLRDFVEFVERRKEKNLEILVCSEGGSGEAANGISDYMRGSKKKFTVTAIGRCESSGMIILSAGDKRRAYPKTTFMVHRPRLGNNTFLNRLKNRKKLGIYIRNYQSIFPFKVKKGGMYFDVEEVKKLGLIDEIIG